MPRTFQIVEHGLPQPQPEQPIPGCTESRRLHASMSPLARYESMPGPREIRIRSGEVIIFARRGMRAEASTLTLDLPKPGPASEGADDEKVIRIVSLTPHAHTVTTPVGGFGGNKRVATFAAAIGSSIELMALGGVWYVTANHNVKLS